MIEWKFEDFQDRFIQLGKYFIFSSDDSVVHDGHFTVYPCHEIFQVAFNVAS